MHHVFVEYANYPPQKANTAHSPNQTTQKKKEQQEPAHS